MDKRKIWQKPDLNQRLPAYQPSTIPGHYFVTILTSASNCITILKEGG